MACGVGKPRLSICSVNPSFEIASSPSPDLIGDRAGFLTMKKGFLFIKYLVIERNVGLVPRTSF